MFAAALVCVSLPAALAAEDARPLSAAEFEARLAGFVAHCREARRPHPEAVVPGGVRLYRAVGGLRGTSHARRGRLRRAIAGKLLPVRDRLIRRGLRWEADRAALARGRRPRPVPPAATFAGPREQARARELIALVQSVIAPETWDVNGGFASVRYFDLYQALVVKAPQRVHGELGEALGGLRR